MRLQDPQLQNLLAGEYVLGTLRGPARRRFERLLQDDRGLQGAVQFWEDALAPLDAIEPQLPDRDLLPGIQQRLGWSQEGAQPTEMPRPPSPGSNWRLPWLPALAFALVAAVSIALWAPWQPRFTPAFAVNLQTEDGTGVWQVAVDDQHNWLDLRALSSADIDADKDLELWLLVDGSDPISLGLIPENAEQRRRLDVGGKLERGSGLAISVEPRGGSPTGKPTGPVIAAQKFPT